MEQQDTSLLREIHKLTKENNTILRKLQKGARRNRLWRIVRISITLGLLFGAYYLVQPFIQNLTNAYGSIQNSFQEIQETKNSISDFSVWANLKKDRQ